ncbi:MAG: hypothetical protein H6728_14935 [Myxococcales bacterium]|nr:hypothetical protein [Myxococcales bacterium]MCB9644365.1 hypothetical protein [Myxococcales bacterium]
MQRYETHTSFFGHTPLRSRTPLPGHTPLSLRDPLQTPAAIRLRPNPDQPREALQPQRPLPRLQRNKSRRFFT